MKVAIHAEPIDKDTAQEEKEEGPKDYEVESAFQNILSAEKHKKDPKMLAALKKHAETQGSAHASAIDAIKNVPDPSNPLGAPAKSTAQLREKYASIAKAKKMKGA